MSSKIWYEEKVQATLSAEVGEMASSRAQPAATEEDLIFLPLVGKFG